ncbi:MAG: 3-oxoacyl-ACP synthase [Lentisphaerae bacterium RIFOXYA12_64_32]|nr:MAG: 3-oxoacyl-ACP synthase [Lentisphaerae bacterium RIFOXYA12_64_32]
MTRTRFLGTGHYVPSKVVANDDLAKVKTTSDEWIQQRVGVRQRHYVDFEKEPMGASDLAVHAARAALLDAQVSKDEIDLIIYATLSPDRAFPGDGVLVQAKLDIPAGVPALDVRNQCSGFLYGLAVADSFIRQGTYRRVLLIGSEVQSTGLDFSDRGRDVAVIFGDGAGAVVLGPSEDEQAGIRALCLHADGRFANELHTSYPSSAEMPRLTPERLASGVQYPQMNGKTVFKHAVSRMPEAILEVLSKAELTAKDIDLFIPHQANLRITDLVQRRLELSDAQVFNNIQDYGNTTAASIPLAIDQAAKQGRLKRGDLLCLAAFGAGFTWAAAAIRW